MTARRSVDVFASWLVLVGIWPLPIADLLTPVGLLDLAAHATGWLILHHRWRIVRRRNQWTVTWTTAKGVSICTFDNEGAADSVWRAAALSDPDAHIRKEWR